ncbi:MAG: hypothetical protein EBU85_07415 [Actinobacteria bacterium]|nr:hypothetical protein [Actinomycetota bacterium]
MSEPTLRGMRIGSAPSLIQRASDLVPRVAYSYTCPQGHEFSVPMATDVEPPVVWDCRCGAVGLRNGEQPPVARAVRTSRSHWDILLERRSMPELEALLAERLAALHTGDSPSADAMGDAAIDISRPALSNPRLSNGGARKSA